MRIGQRDRRFRGKFRTKEPMFTDQGEESRGAEGRKMHERYG